MSDINIKIDRQQKPKESLGRGKKQRWSLPLEELHYPIKDSSGEFVYDCMKLEMSREDANAMIQAIRSHIWRWRQKQGHKNISFSVTTDSNGIVIWRTK
tara:strand:+ start:1481 stop:1777 length:297 start_codon:yes stop_codon:yes gene_type:complete